MAEETEDSEPSMDNILSSIREILSEDEGGAEPKGEKPQISASETNSIASSDQNIGVPADVDLSKQKPDAKITDTGNVQMTENISDVNAVEDSNLDTNSEDILELTPSKYWSGGYNTVDWCICKLYRCLTGVSQGAIK